MIDITTIPPSPEEYNALRASVGWPTFSTAAARDGLKNTLFGVCIRERSRLIAYGRVVGDGAITFYIQDVIVLPGWRRRGHAQTILQRLLQYIKNAADPGSVVGLMSAKGTEELYEKFGFVRRPFGDKMGAGMVLI